MRNIVPRDQRQMARLDLDRLRTHALDHEAHRVGTGWRRRFNFMADLILRPKLRSRRWWECQNIALYVSATSLNGVPSGSVNTARCSSTASGIASIAGLLPNMGASVSHPSGRGSQSSFADSIRRRKFEAWTARPKGISVVSSCRFMSSVRRAGTYQLAASDRI